MTAPVQTITNIHFEAQAPSGSTSLQVSWKGTTVATPAITSSSWTDFDIALSQVVGTSYTIDQLVFTRTGANDVKIRSVRITFTDNQGRSYYMYGTNPNYYPITPMFEDGTQGFIAHLSSSNLSGLPFSDDFNRPDSGVIGGNWKMDVYDDTYNPIPSPTWAISANRAVLVTPTFDSSLKAFLYQDFRHNKLDIVATLLTHDSAGGVFFRSDERFYNYIAVTTTGIQKVSNGSGQQLANFSYPSGATVHIVDNYPTFTVYMNGTQVYTSSNTSYGVQSSRAGFRSSYSTVYFGDIAVSAIGTVQSGLQWSAQYKDYLTTIDGTAVFGFYNYGIYGLDGERPLEPDSGSTPSTAIQVEANQSTSVHNTAWGYNDGNWNGGYTEECEGQGSSLFLKWECPADGRYLAKIDAPSPGPQVALGVHTELPEYSISTDDCMKPDGFIWEHPEWSYPRDRWGYSALNGNSYPKYENNRLVVGKTHASMGAGARMNLRSGITHFSYQVELADSNATECAIIGGDLCWVIDNASSRVFLTNNWDVFVFPELNGLPGHGGASEIKIGWVHDPLARTISLFIDDNQVGVYEFPRWRDAGQVAGFGIWMSTPGNARYNFEIIRPLNLGFVGTAGAWGWDGQDDRFDYPYNGHFKFHAKEGLTYYFETRSDQNYPPRSDFDFRISRVSMRSNGRCLAATSTFGDPVTLYAINKDTGRNEDLVYSQGYGEYWEESAGIGDAVIRQPAQHSDQIGLEKFWNGVAVSPEYPGNLGLLNLPFATDILDGFYNPASVAIPANVNYRSVVSDGLVWYRWEAYENDTTVGCRPQYLTATNPETGVRERFYDLGTNGSPLSYPTTNINLVAENSDVWTLTPDASIMIFNSVHYYPTNPNPLAVGPELRSLDIATGTYSPLEFNKAAILASDSFDSGYTARLQFQYITFNCDGTKLIAMYSKGDHYGKGDSVVVWDYPSMEISRIFRFNPYPNQYNTSTSRDGYGSYAYWRFWYFLCDDVDPNIMWVINHGEKNDVYFSFIMKIDISASDTDIANAMKTPFYTTTPLQKSMFTEWSSWSNVTLSAKQSDANYRDVKVHFTPTKR